MCRVYLGGGGGGGGGGGDQGMFPPPKKTCFSPKIIWQNNGNYTGIALFFITFQVLESLVVLLKYMLKAKAVL